MFLHFFNLGKLEAKVASEFPNKGHLELLGVLILCRDQVLPVIVVGVVVEAVPGVVPEGVLLFCIGLVTGQENLVDLLLGFELSILHLLPGALFSNLAAKTVKYSRVEQGQVDAPLLLVLLRQVLLIPGTDSGLVRDVEGIVDRASNVRLEFARLGEQAEDGIELRLADFVLESGVVEIAVSVTFPVNVRAMLLEFRLVVLVNHL